MLSILHHHQNIHPSQRSGWISSDPKMRTRTSYIPYTHSPINRNRSEIRLLILHPGDFDSPIRRSVSHLSLDEKDWKTDEFKYIALSYRWSEGDREILIDGRQFKIGDNLFNALLQLRQIPRTTVWADVFVSTKTMKLKSPGRCR